MAITRRLLTGSSITLLSQLLTLGLTLFLTPIIISQIGKEDYGLWALLIAIFGQYELLDFGLSLSMSRFFAKALGSGRIEELNELASTVFRVFIIIAGAVLFFFALMWVWAPHFVTDPGKIGDVRIILACYGPIMACSFIIRLHQSLLKAHLFYDRLAYAAILRQLISGAMTYAALRAGWGIIALAVAQCTGMLLELGLITRLSRSSTPGLAIHWRGFKKSRFKEIFGYSSLTFLIRTANTLRSGIDPLIIGSILGLTPITYYSIGIRFVTFLGDMICSISGGPLISSFSQFEGRGERKKVRELYLLSLRLGGCLATFGALSLIFYGSFFLQWWMGPGYTLSYYVMAIAALPMAVYALSYPAQSLLYAVAKHRYLAHFFIAGGIANALLSISLAHFMGVLGVVCGTALETLVVFGFLLPRTACREAGISLAANFKAMAHGTLATALLLIPFFALAYPFLSEKLSSLALIGALQTLFFLPLAWFFILKEEEKSFLIDRLSRKKPQPATHRTEKENVTLP